MFVFRNMPQLKNANIANFVLAVPLEITVLIENATSKCNSLIPVDMLFHIYWHHDKAANCQYVRIKSYNNANIANFAQYISKKKQDYVSRSNVSI